MSDKDPRRVEAGRRYAAKRWAQADPATRKAVRLDDLQDIVVALAGDEAVLQAGLLSDGWDLPIPDEASATDEVDGAQRLSPLGRQRLLDAEADELDLAVDDETQAGRAALALTAWGDRVEAAALLAYLRVVTEGFVARHQNAIRAITEALLREHTLDGATAVAVVRGSRCACHGYTPPEMEIDMRIRPKPEPTPPPVVTSDGYQVVMPQPLTLDHPHARVCREGFWAAVAELPGNRILRRRVWVRAGQLVDDRGATYQRHRDRFRRPRRADGEAAR